MKTKNLLTVIVLCVTTLTTIAQTGKITRRNIRIKENFTSVSISGGWDLILSQGNKTEIIAETDEVYLENLIVEVKNKTLYIYNKGNTVFRNIFKGKNTPRRIYITMSEINSLKASGGCDILTQTALKTDKLVISLSGGSDIKNLILSCNSLVCRASGGSDINIQKLETETCDLSLSGGSDASLSGKVKYLTINASGGSDVSASELEAVDCNARFSGGSDGSIRVTGELNISATGASDIKCYGNPQNIVKHTSGASSLKLK